MRRHKVAAAPDPVGNTFDQSAWTRSIGTPLPTVDHLMPENAHHLVLPVMLGDTGDMVSREVDLFVVIIQILASGVGDTRHASQDKRH